jgi:alpha-glucuronidase
MRRTSTLFVVLILLSWYSYAESGSPAWLGYARLDPSVAAQYASLPSTLVAMDDSAVLKSAQTELVRGIRGMLGRTLRIETQLPHEPVIVIGTVRVSLPAEEFWFGSLCFFA